MPLFTPAFNDLDRTHSEAILARCYFKSHQWLVQTLSVGIKVGSTHPLTAPHRQLERHSKHRETKLVKKFVIVKLLQLLNLFLSSKTTACQLLNTYINLAEMWINIIETRAINWTTVEWWYKGNDTFLVLEKSNQLHHQSVSVVVDYWWTVTQHWTYKHTERQTYNSSTCSHILQQWQW